MVRHRRFDFVESQHNKNTTATRNATYVSASSVARVGGEPNKGRKLSSFWSPSDPHFWWLNQIPMHCMKADDRSTSASSSISAEHLQSVQRSFHQTSFTPSPEAGEEENEEGIKAVREKLMLDLKTKTDKIRKELVKENDDDRVVATTASAVLKEGEFEGGLTDVTL